MIENEQDPVYQQFIKMRKYGGTCYLCKNTTRSIGIFVPYKKSVYDTPLPNKDRYILYYLCNSCSKNIDDAVQKVENKILQEMFK